MVEYISWWMIYVCVCVCIDTEDVFVCFLVCLFVCAIAKVGCLFYYEGILSASKIYYYI